MPPRHTIPPFRLLALLACVPATAPGCGAGAGEDRAAGAEVTDQDTSGALRGGFTAEQAAKAAVSRAVEAADTVVARLQPVPLLRPAEIRALRRYDNDANLDRARALGIRSENAEELERRVRAGELVALADSSPWWTVRELDSSHPYVTPDAAALLDEIGRRFQARLAELDLPAYRPEISSALRTAADQASLRQTNVNATAGTSAHEYGTTVDLAYAGYAAPIELPEDLLVPGPEWFAEPNRAIARLALERAAARKSRELQAILGKTLMELQSEGRVLVTLEELQPVYHITVARRMAPSRD